jgi:hypothetical protein
MVILQATGELRKVSLWWGPAEMQTTEVYLRADPTDKLEARGNDYGKGSEPGRRSAWASITLYCA